MTLLFLLLLSGLCPLSSSLEYDCPTEKSRDFVWTNNDRCVRMYKHDTKERDVRSFGPHITVL